MPLSHTVHELKLNNGVRGLLIDVPGSRAVHYEFNFRAGYSYAKADNISQVAHIMEHLVFGATEKYPSIESFSQVLTQNGAYHNAHTDEVNMYYDSDCSISEWERILDLQRLAISKPVFTEQAFESEKKNVVEELTANANDFVRVLRGEAMSKKNILWRRDVDKLLTVDNVSLDDINDHHLTTHTLDNMKFVVVGDLLKHKDKFISNLGSWELPKGKEFSISKDQPNDERFFYKKRDDAPNLYYQLYYFVPRELSYQDSVALNIVNHVLTGTFHSRIFGKARKQGLAYGVGCGHYFSPTQASWWGLGGQVSRDNANDLFKLFSQELAKLFKDGITQQELESAKKFRLGSFDTQYQTVTSLASWYSEDYFDSDERDELKDFPDVVNGVTVDDIKRVINEFTSVNNWMFSGLGNLSESEFMTLHQSFAERMKEVI